MGVLSCFVAAVTLYTLLMPAFTLEKELFCDLEEHTHTEACYTSELVCGLEETEGHTHGDECFDEEGNLICGLEESEGHTHTDECWQQSMTCRLAEHVHTRACYSDPNADRESAAIWELTLPSVWGMTPSDALVAVAKSQLGYEESRQNFAVTDTGAEMGYTRYGDWFGQPYGAWDAMFVSFCLHYAGIDNNTMPQRATAWEMVEALHMARRLAGADPVPGDLVFFGDSDPAKTQVGIVYSVDRDAGTMLIIQGDYNDTVAQNTIAVNDSRIMGFGRLPDDMRTVPADIEITEEPAPEAQEPVLEPEEPVEGAEEPGEEPEEPVEGAEEPGEETEEPGEESEEPGEETEEPGEESEEAGEESGEETEIEDEPAPEAQEPVVEDIVEFTSKVNGISVRVEAPRTAFPEGTIMVLKAMPAEDVMNAVTDVVNGQIVHVEAVDISFWINDVEIEPGCPIRVYMQPASAVEGAEQVLIHVNDDGSAQEVKPVTDAEVPADGPQAVAFDADSFSVYALVYTVDFHFEVNGETFDFTLPGGGYISFRSLVEALGIAADDKSTEADELQAFVDDVKSIEFSNPALMSVSKAEEETTVWAIKENLGLSCQYSSNLTKVDIATINAKTVKAGDWALITLQPFDTEETLTVTMANGDVWTIQVTDAQIRTTVVDARGNTMQVTVEVSNPQDVDRLADLQVNELTGRDDAYWTAYDAVVAKKNATEPTFDEETFGFFAADIKLLDANGEEFEPAGTVNVKIELISLPADAETLLSTMEVQHLAERFGRLFVETVATAQDVTTVEDVITTQFDVKSFSTFTLSWTGEGETVTIGDDEAKAVLNINSGNETYATVNIHYVDEYGHNIQRPSTISTPVNVTTPVTIEGLLNPAIDGYAYQGAYYREETDQAVNSIEVSRTSSETTGTNYTYIGITGDNGRIGNSQSAPSGYDAFYTDTTGTTEIYFGNSRWRTMDGERYRNGTVYGARTGTVTNYNYTLSFDNTEIADLTNTNTSGTWENAADIYLVYKSTDTSKKNATIHFGTINPDGSFTELEQSTSLDTNAASISFGAAVSGYDCVGAYYCENESSTPADDGTDIQLTLRKVEDAWQYTDTSTAAEKGFVEDGSHIYVVYKEKTTSSTQTPSEGEIPTPSTIKNVTSNGDGTYTIQLDIIGQEIVKEVNKGANVLLIFDRTSSMHNTMTGATNRFEAAKSAVRTLVTALNPGTNPVQMAVFSFDRYANDGVSWTTSGTDITNYTDALTMAPDGSTPGGGGTNWEAAFAEAKTYLATADSDPTYVIFLTDGNPTIYVGSNTIRNATATSLEYTRARAEAAGLSSSLKIYGILCANASDGPLLQTLVNDLSSAAYGSHDMTYIHANDSTTMTNTFNNIAQHIVNELGATDVSTTDGMTSLSSVSASVSGAAGAFNYYKAYQVAQDDQGYYYIDDSGERQAVAASDVETYTYKDSEGNTVTYRYCNRSPWDEAPGASYSESTGVTWDLGSEGKLGGGVIYSISFTVWPSQEAYDLLADLNNGIKDYDDLEPEIQDQVYESGGVYYMKTNTSLDTTYTFGTNTYSDEIGFYQGAMDLDSEVISLKKNWPENMLDSYGAATYRDENGVEHTATEITLTITRDGGNYMDVTVDAANQWQASDVFISCGVMTVENGVATIKEHGHDYSVTEPAGFSYYWDLIADVYHPMVINGVTTMLILDKNATEANVDNVNYFKIDGKIYRKDNANDYTLEADNYRRSNLNITKVVNPTTAPEEDKFRYTVKVTDAESTDGNVWFSAWDPAAGTTVKDTTWVISGATPEDGNTGYWYATNGATIVFDIKAGWNVRFLNLKHNSTFEVEEMEPGEGYSFVNVAGSATYAFIGTNTTWYTVDAENTDKVTGTIIEPNNSYTLTYTNQWSTIDIQLKKVDEANQPLSGSSFTLMRKQGETWVNVQEGYKPGDTASSTPNPVDLGGLGVGNYRLVENIAPDGYIILSNYVEFEVYKDSADGTLKARLANGTTGVSIEGPGTGETPTYIISVTNTPGSALPHTGGPGALFYTLGGIALMLGAAMMYGFRLRRRDRRLNRNSL